MAVDVVIRSRPENGIIRRSSYATKLAHRQLEIDAFYENYEAKAFDMMDSENREDVGDGGGGGGGGRGGDGLSTGGGSGDEGNARGPTNRRHSSGDKQAARVSGKVRLHLGRGNYLIRS